MTEDEDLFCCLHCDVELPAGSRDPYCSTCALNHASPLTVIRELRARVNELEAALEKWRPTEGDEPLPEDDAIRAAFPTRSGQHELYGEAMRLVGARRSKGGLVALVNWLLRRIAERDTRLVELEDLAGKAVCAFCGEVSEKTPEAMVEHQIKCPKRKDAMELQLRAHEAKLAELVKENEDLRSLLQRGTGLMQQLENDLNESNEAIRLVATATLLGHRERCAFTKSGQKGSCNCGYKE